MAKLTALALLVFSGAVGCAADDMEFDPAVDDFVSDGAKADGATCPTTPAALARARAAVRSAAGNSHATAAQKRALGKAVEALTTTGQWLGAFDYQGRSLHITYYWLTAAELTTAQARITAAAALLAPYARLAPVRRYVEQAAAEFPTNDLSDATVGLAELRCMPVESQTNMFTLGEFEERAIDPGDASLAALQPAFAEVLDAEQSLWGDTVLEGDVGKNGDATIANVDVLSQGGSILGYRLHITAEAVGTGAEDCVFDEAIERWTGGGCVPGHIVSPRVVNYDGTPIETDDYADFVEN